MSDTVDTAPEPEADRDAPFDASDPRQVHERVKKAKRADRSSDAVLGALMEQTQGRAWLWVWLENCGVFRSSFSNNALEMARREGERNIGLRLLADIHRVAPHNYIIMCQEAAKNV